MVFRVNIPSPLYLESHTNLKQLTRLINLVRDIARSIPSVFEINLGFARAFERDSELSGSSLSRPHVELVGATGFASLQAHPSGLH